MTGYRGGALPARRKGRKCPAVSPADLGRKRCIMPFGASGHEKLNAANHGQLGLPVLLHRTEDAKHWTIYGVVDVHYRQFEPAEDRAEEEGGTA